MKPSRSCLYGMAQVFPLTADELASEGDRPSLVETLAALPEPWTMLLDRRIGKEPGDPAAIVLVHPEIGIALVSEVPSDSERDPEAGIAALRAYLEEQRFAEFFPGDLPIVALAVGAEDLPVVGEHLAAAFEGVPRLSIADRDWADAVVELLLLPDDLEMAPVAEESPIDALEAEVPDNWPIEDEPLERETERPLMLEDAALAGSGNEPPLPLMADWPMVMRHEPSRWRIRVAIAALSAIFLGGLGVAAWQFTGDDTSLSSLPPAATPPPSPSQRVELALPQPPQGKPPLEPQRARDTPPPLPAAPPVVMAAKPLASPPPAPPEPTAVEPLPPVAANPAPATPSEPPAPTQTAAAESQSSTQNGATETSKEPPAEITHPPPAAQSQPLATKASPPASAAPASESPKPQRVAKATPPSQRQSPAPARMRPAQETQKPAAERPQPEMRGPPIDAADLPPLPASTAPQDQLTGNVVAPRPPAPPRPEPETAVALGPPVPLGRTAANSPAGTANTRECRPYTSDTSVTGRGLAVQGIACRGRDGQWRLVSEVPLH
jgi:hypothetical protein